MKNINGWIVALFVVLALPLISITIFGSDNNDPTTWQDVLDHGITWFGGVAVVIAYLKYRNK